MHRIRDARWREPIGHALDLIGPALVDRIGPVRWFTGDPVFAGLHRYGDTDDGRSYRATAHCCYPVHFAHRPAVDRVTTIVLPYPPSPATVVHELGHALDWRLGFGHTAAPVTWYARVNRWEAFAEAFTAAVVAGYGDQAAAASDRATRALWAALAGTPTP